MSQKQKFCSECGASLDEHDRFCPVCGSKVVDVDENDEKKNSRSDFKPEKYSSSETNRENKATR